MSKFVFIQFNKKQVKNLIQKVEKTLLNIAPSGIEPRIQINDFNTPGKKVYGLLNHFKRLTNYKSITIGQIFEESINSVKLPDGSYNKIEFNIENIIFYCDRLESKTIWYYLDEEKIIVSNSQRAIVSLKESFHINIKSISWFLSSGTIGYLNSWDKDIKKVTNSKKYIFNTENWHLDIVSATYQIKSFHFKNIKKFDEIYYNYTKENIEKFLEKNKKEKFILPISGGNDSRLLFYVIHGLNKSSDIDLINWGENKNYKVFDDKSAAIQLSKFYNKKLLNEYLPSNILDIDSFFNQYVKTSECRIDHFNAYSDHFKIFKNLFHENYNFLIRGDIPFTEGIDLNDRMARAHIGILKFNDYDNYNRYSFDSLVDLQERDELNISRKPGETIIEWRDRLYINYRIPIVISAFNDIINGYIENFSPMMTYSHFELYQNLKNKQKGNKSHIVRLSKKLDKSNIPFNAIPSIPGQSELLMSPENIDYILNYLNELQSIHFKSQLIKEIIVNLQNVNIDNKNKISYKDRIRFYLSESTPPIFKASIKARIKRNLFPLTLAYRVILIDKAIKCYQSDSNLFKNEF